jgi:hypothetical protein
MRDELETLPSSFILHPSSFIPPQENTMSTATGGHTGRAIYTGLTAAGSNQATALPLAGRGDSLQEITTVGSSTGVLLPPIILPMRVEIVNQGAHTLSIYPQPGGTLDDGTANAAETLASGDAVIYEASSLTNWYTVATTGGGGGGTVTSVTFTGDGTVLSSTPSSAVTGSGTLTAALATQSENLVLAGPSSGSAAAPTFRALVAADLPAIASHTVLANTTGSSAAPAADTLTAIIDASIGSTQGDILYRGASAWSVLAAGTSGYVLTTGGAAANPSWSAGAAISTGLMSAFASRNLVM